MKLTLKIFFLICLSFKTNPNLQSQNLNWEKVLSYTDVCVFNKALQTTDSGYICVGQNRIGSNVKMYFLKLNSFGDTIWSRHFDLNVNSVYRCKWVQNTSDNGFIMCGSGAGINSDAYLIKVDSLGNIIWYKTFGGNGIDVAQCVKQLSDGGYIILVSTTSFTDYGMLAIRTDSLGNSIWSKFYLGGAGEIEIVKNSGFIISGVLNDKAYLLRMDNNGDSLWSKNYGEYLGSVGFSIDNTEDNGFIVGGICDTSISNNKKSYVIKTDSTGNIQWSNRYSTSYNEWCYSIRSVNNSKYVMCGMSDSLPVSFERAFIRLIDKNGSILSEKFYRGAGGKISNSFYSVENTNDKGFILCGFTNIGSGRGYIVKTDSMLNIKPVGIKNEDLILKDFNLFQNYPNPFNPKTIINYELKATGDYLVILKVFDILGNEIANLVNEKQEAGSYSFTFDGSNFPSGVYFYRLEAGGFVETRKMLIVK